MQRYVPAQQQPQQSLFSQPLPQQSYPPADDNEEDYDDDEEFDDEDGEDPMEEIPKASGGKPMHLSDQRFADLAKSNLISPLTAKAIIETMGFEFMTIVQAATLRHLLTGADV